MKSTYDIIIIGGGATGSGIALDAVLRGYKTLLVEQDDFASKTSSNSTKLVHGGVRYLEKAFLNFDKTQFDFVMESLKERYYFLNNATHLSCKIELFSPLFKWYEFFYILSGLKLYDFISFSKSFGKSCFSNKIKTKLIHPFLNSKALGSVSFFDGSFNDSKMVISLLQSAKELGCDIINYSEVRSFIYEDSLITGLNIFNKIEKKETQYKANVIINATGYFCDKIRKLDDNNTQNIITLSKGSHIVVAKKYLPNQKGIIFQKTSDNRVIFMIPWNNHTLIGTTEEKTDFTNNPKISKEEIEYLLKNINSFLNIKLSKKDILSSFSGIRPLIKNENINSSSDLVREHIILQSKSNLISITGGKWTTYRKMAEECLDFVINKNLLEYKKECETKNYKVIGSRKSIRNCDLKNYSLDEESKTHLINNYGDQSLKLLNEIKNSEFRQKFDSKHAFIKAEVIYCIRHEFIQKPNDFIFRRISLGKVDLQYSKKILATVVSLMSKELNWSNERNLQEYQEALKEINELLQTIH